MAWHIIRSVDCAGTVARLKNPAELLLILRAQLGRHRVEDADPFEVS